MTVTALHTAASAAKIDDIAAGQHPRDEAFRDAGFGLLLTAGVLCNDALLPAARNGPNESAPLGDPTEVALLAAAANAGLTKHQLQNALPRIAELPFTSERKRMTTVHALHAQAAATLPEIAALSSAPGAASIAFTKGSVESLLDRSTSVWMNGSVEALTDTWRQRLLSRHNELARTECAFWASPTARSPATGTQPR